MNTKQPHVNQNHISPSSLMVNEQQSQMSVNSSFINKSPLINQVGDQQPNRRKRLKFDRISQGQLRDSEMNMQQTPSQQQIQVQFHLSNCIKWINDFMKSNCFSYFYVFVLVLFLVNCTIESALISQRILEITQNTDLVIQIFFTLTILAKLTQYQNQQLFWLLLDITTNLSGYMAFGLRNVEQPARYFNAFKILRLLLIIKQSSFLHLPAAKLVSSLSSVSKIMFPAVLFIYFYAVIGLYSFRDYEYTKCREPANRLLSSNWTVYSQKIFLCGEKECPVLGGVQYECLNPIDYGVQPNPAQVKNIMQGYGLMRYNNIFYSLFSTFKQTFITGSSRLMILGKQVTNYFYVLIYYLSFIYLLAYIYLNIFYGLMITNEEDAQDGINGKRESMFELKLYRASSRRRISKLQEDDGNEKLKLEKPSNEGQLRNSTNKQWKKSQKNIQKRSSIIKNPTTQHLQQVIDPNNQKLNNGEEQPSTSKPMMPQKRSKFYQLQEDSNLAKVEYQQQSAIQFGLSGTQFGQSEGQLELRDDDIDKEKNLLKYGEIMKKYYLINHIIVIFCSLNILVDWEGQTYSTKLIVDSIDFAFFWIYLAEMLFRFAIHRIYVPDQPMDRAGKIDFIVFFFCACGQTYQIATASGVQHFLMASDQISRLLRTIKYLRIYLLISSTPYFNQAKIIFNSMLQAVYSVRYLSALWLLIVVTFSIMGYHMFHGKVKIDHQGHLDLENGHPQHLGFQGIVDAFIYTVFIFFNEEWDWILFEQYVSQQVWIVIWVLIVLVIGLQILSKYFMALLMKELGDKLNEREELLENQDQILEDQQQVSKINISIRNSNKVAPLPVSVTSPIHNQKRNQRDSLMVPKQPQFVKKSSSQYSRENRCSVNMSNGLVDIRMSQQSNEENRKQKQIKLENMRNLIMRDSQIRQADQNDKNSKGALKRHSKIKSLQKQQLKMEQMSCFELIKMKLVLILRSRFFIVVKVFTILVSIVCTVATNPLNNPNSAQAMIYTSFWHSTVIFFGVEIVLSILVFGFINEKGGYFRNIMNWIYFLVFVIEIISISPGLIESAHLQPILSFRILRIFVLIELRYDADADMRLTIVGFWKLLPKVANLLAITIIMYGFFAIILVKLYKDDYYYCDGYESHATIVTQKDCMNWGGSWVQRHMNVSNIFKSLLYLFLVATTEGWSTQVIESASLAGKDRQPEYGHNIWMEYFFAVFFFFGNMIMLNVFIGLSVYNFQKIKSQVTGLSRLTKDQKMWFSIKNTIYRLSPTMKDTPPDNCFSQYVHTFKNSYTYKIINVILFLLFMTNMSLYTTNMDHREEYILDAVLNIFVGIFMFEYAVSWIALGTRVIRHKKFIFESIGIVYFVIVFIWTQGWIIEPKIDRILHGIVICLLAVRYFALLNDVEFVRKMINSLVSIFPQTYNIWLLLFVTLFTYAVIGIYFFGYLKVSPELNQFDQNYSDIHSAIYALIKFSTLESPILQIIDSTAKIAPNSVCFDMHSYSDYLQYGRMGCGSVAGYIFFLSFHIIYSLILLSTLLAVIVDAYSQVRRQQQSMVNKFQLQQVQKEWENYDPEATGYIGYRDFWIFTAKLVKIYKVNKEELLSHQTKQSFLKSLQIPIYEDQNGVLSFQFHQVVEALTRIVLQQKMGSQWNTVEADKVFKNHHHHANAPKMFKKSVYDSSHVLTLIVMKSGLKAWKRKAVKTAENQQNLQQLLTMAKRDNLRAETYIHDGTKHNGKHNEIVPNELNSVSKINIQSKRQVEIDKNTLKPQRRGKNPFQSMIVTQNEDSNKATMRRQSMQNVNFDLNLNQSPQLEGKFNENIKQDKHTMQQPKNHTIDSARQKYNKIKSTKDAMKNAQSQRVKQNINLLNMDDKKQQQEQQSELEEIQ